MARAPVGEIGVDLQQKARDLRSLIAEHADEAERNRRVSTPVIEALASAGVFHMFVPREFGGGEVDVGTGVRVFEELAKADGSTGWIAMIGATTGVVSAYFPHHVSREVFRLGVITGGVVAPRGTAVPEGDAYRVNGRWSFASGCEHSEWLACACMVQGDGAPDVRMALFRTSDAEIIDTW